MAWQWIVQQWLRQQAEQAVRERFAEAVKQRAAEATPDENAMPPHCHVGLVFALGIESGGFQDLLDDVHTMRGAKFIAQRGTLAGRGITIIEAGVGAAAAERGTRALLLGHRPDWVISAGFSGGLQPGVKRGDIVLAQGVTSSDGAKLSIDLKVDEQWLASTRGCHAGQILTVNEVINSPAEKRRLGEEHGALCVDMESYVVAEVCRQAKQKFLAVRVISDTVDEALPADVAKLATYKTNARRIGAAVGALWRRPGSGKDMLRFQQQAIEASDRLAEFLAGLILPLAPLAEAEPPEE